MLRLNPRAPRSPNRQSPQGSPTASCFSPRSVVRSPRILRSRTPSASVGTATPPMVGGGWSGSTLGSLSKRALDRVDRRRRHAPSSPDLTTFGPEVPAKMSDPMQAQTPTINPPVPMSASPIRPMRSASKSDVRRTDTESALTAQPPPSPTRLTAPTMRPRAISAQDGLPQSDVRLPSFAHSRSQSASSLRKGPPPPITVSHDSAMRQRILNRRFHQADAGPVISTTLRRSASATSPKAPTPLVVPPRPQRSASCDDIHTVQRHSTASSISSATPEPPSPAVIAQAQRQSFDAGAAQRIVSTASFDFGGVPFVMPPDAPDVPDLPRDVTLHDGMTADLPPPRPMSTLRIQVDDPSTPRASNLTPSPQSRPSVSSASSPDSTHISSSAATSFSSIHGPPVAKHNIPPHHLAKAYLARSRRSASLGDPLTVAAPPLSMAGRRARTPEWPAQIDPTLARAVFAPLPSTGRPRAGSSSATSGASSDDDGFGSEAESDVGSSGRRTSVSASLPPVSIDPPPFPWQAVDVGRAREVLGSKGMQRAVLQAMAEYGGQEGERPIHALVLEGIDELPTEITRRIDELELLQDAYGTELRHREKLLRRHVAVLNAFNGDAGGRFASSLLASITRTDALAQRLAVVTDHIGRVERLRDSHFRGGASLGLARLNASYTRSRKRAKDAEAALERVARERDQARSRVRELEERMNRLEPTSQPPQQYALRPQSLTANSAFPTATFDAFPAVPSHIAVADVVEALEPPAPETTPTPPDRDSVASSDDALQPGDDDTADLSAAVSAAGPIIIDEAESSPDVVVRPPSSVLPPMATPRAMRTRRQGSASSIGSASTSPTQSRRLTGALKARFEAFRQGSLPGPTSPASELPYINVTPARPTMHIRAQSEPPVPGRSLAVPSSTPATTSTLLHDMDDPFAPGPGRVRKPRVSGGLSSIPLDALASVHIDQMLMRDMPAL